jgi:hypothetical protein
VRQAGLHDFGRAGGTERGCEYTLYYYYYKSTDICRRPAGGPLHDANYLYISRFREGAGATADVAVIPRSHGMLTAGVVAVVLNGYIQLLLL